MRIKQTAVVFSSAERGYNNVWFGTEWQWEVLRIKPRASLSWIRLNTCSWKRSWKRLSCCFPSLRACRRCVSSFEVAFLFQMSQLQLADAAAVFNSTDIRNKANWRFALYSHFFNLWVFSVLWQVKYVLQSIRCLCVCIQRSICIYIYLEWDWLCKVQASNTNKTKTAVRNTQFYLFSQFICEECFPLPFSVLHCSRSLACQCWLNNKLMVCLLTLWDMWRCTEGDPTQMRMWALKKIDWIIPRNTFQLWEMYCMNMYSGGVLHNPERCMNQ